MKNFMKEKEFVKAFEIIFTDNDHEDVKNNVDKEYYKKSFKDVLGKKFKLLKIEVDNFGSFSTCLYLAQPHVDG